MYADPDGQMKFIGEFCDHKKAIFRITPVEHSNRVGGVQSVVGVYEAKYAFGHR